jgi:diguanylate cyclase
MSRLPPLFWAFTAVKGWALLFLCFNGAFWALLLLRPVGHAELVAIDDILQCIGPLLAVPLCVGRLRRQWLGPSLCLGLGILAYVMGQGMWAFNQLIAHQIPLPWYDDLAFLVDFSLLLLGVMFLSVRPLLHVSRLRVGLDAFMMMTAIITFSWYFILGPMLLQGNSSLLAKVVSTAYPSGDLILLLCVILLWLRQDDRVLRPVLLLLSLGLLTLVLTDSIYDYLNVQGNFVIGGLIDPLWSLSFQLVGLSVVALQRVPKLSLAVSSQRSRSLWQTLLPYVFIPILSLLLLYVWWTPGNTTLETGVYVGAILLVGLVLVRQIVAIQELHMLYANNDALASANRQLEVQATHDALTGLPNRNLLQRRLEQAIHLARKSNIPAALLLVDLDRFKEVNDTLGHDIGDLLLQEVGPRLQGHLRPTDLLTRLGGDEFAIVLPTTDANMAIQITRTLLEALSVPFLIGEHAFDVGGSIGIALTPEFGFEGTTLLRCADVAMYVAKRSQSGYVVYSQEIDHYSPRKLALMNELRQTIANDGLLLCYQPKVSLFLGQIIGVEALVRWPHPVHGLIPPDEFIPLAEQTGLIGPLTRWVLERAIRQCRDWERGGLYLKMAVNLSTRTLYDPELLATVTDLLQANEVAPSRLILEITEGTLMDDPERAHVALTHLRDSGVSISLDDFGTGYSSLAYLKRLPLDEIKIDKTFVLGLDADGSLADIAIVRAVVAMARPLQCEVVAEGVESQEVWKLLRELGCDLAQGYYLSRPLPAAALEQWIRTSPWGAPEVDVAAIA